MPNYRVWDGSIVDPVRRGTREVCKIEDSNFTRDIINSSN